MGGSGRQWWGAVEGMSTCTVPRGKSSQKASLFTCCLMSADRISLLAGSTPFNVASPLVDLTLGLQLILFSQWISTTERGQPSKPLSDIHSNTIQSAAPAGARRNIDDWHP